MHRDDYEELQWDELWKTCESSELQSSTNHELDYKVLDGRWWRIHVSSKRGKGEQEKDGEEEEEKV